MTDSFSLDPAVAREAAALRRLESEHIAWLGSIGRNGYPHAVPVWFLWHEGTAVVFAQPRSAKVKNLRADPKALLHLEAGADGEQMHILQGEVEIAAEPAAGWLAAHGLLETYLTKYASGLANLGWDAERMFDDYSSVLILHPHRLIAY